MNDAEYKVLPLDKLQPFLIRQLRPNILAQLKERISQGYNPARPITVIRNDGHFIVADGNHRLSVLSELNFKEVPVIIREGDPYTLAVQCNQDEDTYAPMDLFDWLDIIKSLKSSKSNQEIAVTINWSKAKVDQYSSLLSGVHTKVLELAITQQQGRVSEELTNVFNFTEGFFRNSGLYDLNHRYQLKIMREFLSGKVSKQKIQAQCARYAWHQQLKEYAIAHLAKEVSLREVIILFRHINSNAYGGEPGKGKIGEELYQDIGKSIAALNDKATGIKLFCDDTLKRIPRLDDNSLSLIVTDPPYNVTDLPWDKFETPEAYLEWFEQWLNALKPKLCTDYHLFVFCDPSYMARIENLLVKNSWPLKSRIIWSYRNLVMGRDVSDKFISSWQPVFHCGTHSLNWPPDWTDRRFDVLQYAVPQSNFTDKKVHESSKPIDLIKLFVELGSKPGDMVLDCFAGGGTTGDACKQVGQRKCLLIEQDDNYCSLIENRLKIKRMGGDVS